MDNTVPVSVKIDTPAVPAAPAAPVTDYNQPAAPEAVQPPEGYTGPWPSIYKDADGNPTNTYAPGVTLVDAGDPTAW